MSSRLKALLGSHFAALCTILHQFHRLEPFPPQFEDNSELILCIIDRIDDWMLIRSLAEYCWLVK